MQNLFLKPLIPLNQSNFRFQFPAIPTINNNRIQRRRRRSKLTLISARLNNNNNSSEETNQQQLNLSVLRFTLGIPGIDESYLPRWIGYTFGSLLIINHFFGSNSFVSSSQLISEALGLSLAAFSATLPYLGRFLKGASLVEKPALPEGNKQIFVMSEDLSDTLKEDLAWGTYVLLKNTNSVSVLISAQGALCLRGYWSSSEDASKAQLLDWFEKQIQQIGLSDLKETLYFPQGADSEAWVMLPNGTRSLLVYPMPRDPNSSDNDETTKKVGGFLVLASTMNYAYSNKDRAWIRSVANKFVVKLP